MAARNVAPTKTNLITLRQELELAHQGYELLDQKRNILVIELLGLVDQATDFEDQVNSATGEAFRGLEEAVLAGGRLQVHHLSSAVNITSTIELTSRKVMGVRLPVVNTLFEERAPYFSPAGSSFWIDEAIRGFQGVLELMGRLAELKVSIMRLAREVRRTIRKVNAREKIAIPELDETVAMIQDRLEENERDMFVLMKLVKSRLEAKER
ncbi:MAG: V-type ATP synthase subunit D [Spirochaetales bacterium]|nr:MAG: V-type ATP synthase subunit D [Spirochaetales bacterium]